MAFKRVLVASGDPELGTALAGRLGPDYEVAASPGARNTLAALFSGWGDILVLDRRSGGAPDLPPESLEKLAPVPVVGLASACPLSLVVEEIRNIR